MKRTMKKLSAVMLSLMMFFALAGCGSQDRETEAQTSAAAETATEVITEAATEAAAETAAEETAEAETEAASEENTGAAAEVPAEPASEEKAEEPVSEEGRTLVVYYSATGNTEAVANVIADATGGDLFELEPAEPYSDDDLDWTNDDSRVVYEHDNPEERDVELVETTVPEWESYDTVFIGYPIWWGIAAWPMNTFVENNDFTGKTVIPFCTSSSSGIGDSGTLLADLAGTGDWQEGMRFRSGVDEADVQEWVNGLGL